MYRLTSATQVSLRGQTYYVSKVAEGYYSDIGDTWVPALVTLTPVDGGGPNLKLDADSEEWKEATVVAVHDYVDIRVG